MRVRVDNVFGEDSITCFCDDWGNRKSAPEHRAQGLCSRKNVLLDPTEFVSAN